MPSRYIYFQSCLLEERRNLETGAHNERPTIPFYAFLRYNLSYSPLGATLIDQSKNALKHFLIDQLVKFFLLISQSNVSKYF